MIAPVIALIPLGVGASSRAQAATTAWMSKVPLAVVVHAHLEILRAGIVRTIASGLTIDSLTWSPDDKWLMVEEYSSAKGDQTWAVRVDGTDFHQVDGAVGQVAAWGGKDQIFIGSPSADDSTSTIGEFDPATTDHSVLTSVRGEVGSIAATSTRVAVSSSLFVDPNGFASGTLDLLRLGTSTVTTLAQSKTDSYGSLSFSPNGSELLYDLDPDNSASIAQDGVEFEITRVGTRGTHALGIALSVPSWRSWAPSSAQLAITLGESRAAWSTNKHIALCSAATFTCTNLKTPSGTVAFEPSFSSTGVAYVTASGLGGSDGSGTGSPEASPAAIAVWADTFHIWISQRNGAAKELTALGTASDPRWIGGSSGLLFVREGELWTLASPSAKPVQITTPFLPESDQNYGTFDWSGRYALGS
jgi:hypothetical protein